MTESALGNENSHATAARVGPKSLLLVGLKKEPVESLVPALRRRAVEVASTVSGEIALASCRQRHYDLIVVREPVADVEFADLLTSIRSPGVLSEHSFVQVVTSPGRVEDLEGLSGRHLGVCSVTDFGGLISTISRVILDISPRVELRMMAELMVRLKGGRLSRFCQVANVSETGMLIRTADLIPVGDPVEVVLSLPECGQPLRMSGRIVRHTAPHEISGFALELVDYKGASKRMWCDHLASERSRDETRTVGASGAGLES